MSTNKLTKLKHLTELASRTKAELNALDAKIQEIVTVGGEPNVIDTIKVNGVAQTVTEKAVDISIVHPEYSITKAANSGDYAAVYNLTKDGAIVGASINIPKDIVVKSGSVVGDEIVLVLNDEAATEIKIPVASLIEYVTSGSATGDMIVVNVSDDHKVTATITDGTITLAKLDPSVQESIDKAHTHSFDETVLNGITAAKVTAWDSAEQNAKDYVDTELEEYSTTEEMNAAIKVVDDKFANYYTSTQIDAMVATDSEVTTALDEVFGTQSA